MCEEVHVCAHVRVQGRWCVRVSEGASVSPPVSLSVRVTVFLFECGKRLAVQGLSVCGIFS